MLDYIHILRFRYGKKLSCREIAETQGCGKIAINDFLKKFRESMVIQFSLRRLFEFFLACLFLLAAILRSVTTFERPSDRFFTPYASGPGEVSSLSDLALFHKYFFMKK